MSPPQIGINRCLGGSKKWYLFGQASRDGPIPVLKVVPKFLEWTFDLATIDTSGTAEVHLRIIRDPFNNERVAIAANNVFFALQFARNRLNGPRLIIKPCIY